MGISADNLEEVTGRILDGKSVLVPSLLKENLSKLNRKKVGRDQIVVQYCWLAQFCTTRKEEKQTLTGEKKRKKKVFTPIHSDIFKENLAWSVESRVRQTKQLEELKLIEID